MTPEDIKQAVEAGILDKDQAACFWTWEYCQRHLRLPAGKQIVPGVKRDYGVEISGASAFRGRDMAQRLIFRAFFSRDEKIADFI